MNTTRNNIFLVLPATAAYSYLFYKQAPGINHAVFAYVLTALFALSDVNLLKKREWLGAAACTLVCGTLTGINGTNLNLVMNLISILVLAYVSASPRLSVLTGMAYSGMSAVCGLIINLIFKLNEYASIKPVENPTRERKFKWHYFILPITVLVLFLVLYRESSTAFKNLTDMIDLSFISAPWFFFTFGGFFLLYGLFVIPKEFNFFNSETEVSNKIEHSAAWKSNGFLITGVLLFIMLDVLLAIVNISDIVYFIFFDPANKGMTYSELIHQGIGSLSFSLVLAVGFILVWFNQKDTDPKLKRLLRSAAIAWIFLNIILLCTNIWKNSLYIEAHGLTYLRIGVYFFLFLAFLTLVFCAFKITHEKNNVYMYRRFGITILLLTFVFNCFNWDKITTSYNISRYRNSSLAPDGAYLLQLSPDCLPMIAENWDVINPQNTEVLNRILDYKCAKFKAEFTGQNWRGLTFCNYQTFEKLKAYTPKTGLTLTDPEDYLYYHIEN